LDVAKRIFFGKKCVCDIREKKEGMETSCTFILAMENGWWILIVLVMILFYLEYDRERGKNSSY
jgi:hypothetical protein